MPHAASHGQGLPPRPKLHARGENEGGGGVVCHSFIVRKTEAQSRGLEDGEMRPGAQDPAPVLS